MSTIKSLMDEICDDCAVTVPVNWITTNTLTYRKLKTALYRTARELLDRIDWPEPFTKNIVIPGTGVETYDLPADFLRLTRDPGAAYETTSTRRRGIAVYSNADWTLLQDWGSADGDRYFRIGGDEANGRTVSFFRDLDATQSVTVSYVANVWMQSAAGTEGSTWSVVDDELLLPYDLVELGVRWRSRKGRNLPYAADHVQYQILLSRRATDYRGLSLIRTDERAYRDWRDAVPDVIPSA